jgi:hypothetical protein
LYPYHIQSVEELSSHDAPAACAVCHWILQQSAEDPTCTAEVLFMDSSCFTRTRITSIHDRDILLWDANLQTIQSGYQWLPYRCCHFTLITLMAVMKWTMEDVSFNMYFQMWFEHSGASAHNSLKVC